MGGKCRVVIWYDQGWWYGLCVRSGRVVNLARKYGALRRKLWKSGHRVMGVRQNGTFTPYL